MNILHIIVNNRVASYLRRDGDIVCGNSDYQIEFSFDSMWDAYEEKTARFIWNNQYFDVDFTGTTCDVPVISNVDSVRVGVYAGDLHTTTPAIIGCKRSVLCGSETQRPESAEHYTNEAKKAAEEAKIAADAVTAQTCEINPKYIRKAGSYTVKVFSEQEIEFTSIEFFVLKENGDQVIPPFNTISGGLSLGENVFTVDIPENDYGISIFTSNLPYKVYTKADNAVNALRMEMQDSLGSFITDAYELTSMTNELLRGDV